MTAPRPGCTRGAALAVTLVALAASAEAQDGRVHDPLERMNRGVFAANEWLDRYALEPVARGWDFVLPDPLERALGRLFEHIRFPIVFANDLLQGKPLAAAGDVARFVVNSAFGAGGLLDPATGAGLPAHDEDFGQTLGVWGVPPGPYLVLPILGASSFRDGFGLAVDAFSSPYAWFTPLYVSFAVRATDLLNDRSLFAEQIAQERASAFDFYAFVRSAHAQNRRARVRDETTEEAPAEPDADLYYFEDEEEEEE